MGSSRTKTTAISTCSIHCPCSTHLCRDMLMDWRSRSRSRVSMDWKPASRSRSRVPGQDPFSEAHSHGLLQQDAAGGKVGFPSLGASPPGRGIRNIIAYDAY